MRNEFSEGDVVMLKSGGPQMTVTTVNMDKSVSCVYFNDKNEMTNVHLPAHALLKIEPEDVGA